MTFWCPWNGKWQSISERFLLVDLSKLGGDLSGLDREMGKSFLNESPKLTRKKTFLQKVIEIYFVQGDYLFCWADFWKRKLAIWRSLDLLCLSCFSNRTAVCQQQIIKLTTTHALLFQDCRPNRFARNLWIESESTQPDRFHSQCFGPAFGKKVKKKRHLGRVVRHPWTLTGRVQEGRWCLQVFVLSGPLVSMNLLTKKLD